MKAVAWVLIATFRSISGEDYLSYPLPDNDFFKFGFGEWLERYVVSEGNEFWYFLNP